MEFKQLSSGEIVVAAERLGRLGGGFALNLWIAYRIGTENYGLLAYGLALMALGTTVSGLGLTQVGIKHMSAASRQPESVARHLLQLKLMSGIAAFLVLSGVILAMNGLVSKFAIAGVLMLSAIFQAFDVLDSLLLAKERNAEAAGSRLVAFVISAGAKVAVVVGNGPIWLLALAFVLEPAGYLVAFRRVLRDVWTRPHPAFSSGETKALLHEGWPLLVIAILNVIFARLDILIITELSGLASTGYYALATNVVNGLILLPTAILLANMGGLGRSHAVNPIKFEALFRRKVSLSLIISLAIMVGASVAAKFALSQGLLPRWREALEIVPFLAPLCVVSAFGSYWSYWVTLEGVQRITVWAFLVSLITQLSMIVVVHSMAGGITLVGFALCKVAAAIVGQFSGLLMRPSALFIPWKIK